MQQVNRAAFFVDGDNLSPLAVSRAFSDLARRVSLVNVRRAYGGTQKLVDLKDVLRKNGIRASVNQGRGTTDVALVVDVMDLLHANLLPGVVALASSDADFAPLALRLREAGIKVLCYAERDKAALDELKAVYGEVVLVEDLAEFGAAEQPTPDAARSSVSTSKAIKPVEQALQPNKAEPEVDRIAVKQILAALPKWLPDTVKQLNQLGAPLRDAGVKKGNRPLHDLFRKHPAYFKVLPSTGPAKQVRLLKAP
jgi:NYN domain